jgi:hypothetical protein
MRQAALARRKNRSERLYVGGTRGFGLRRVFPAKILNFLRCQTRQALLIRSSRATLRACPKAKASLFRTDFGEIQRRPIQETSDFGQYVHLIPVSVLAQHEVSTKGVVADETIRLRTAIRGRLSCVPLVAQEAPIQPHFQKVFVTKRPKVLALLRNRHIPSPRTRPHVLQPETVRQSTTTGPLDFGVVPRTHKSVIQTAF